MAACGQTEEEEAEAACEEMCETSASKLCGCGYGCTSDTSSCTRGARACDRTAESCDVQREAMQRWTCADVDAFVRWAENAPRDQKGACGG